MGWTLSPMFQFYRGGQFY